MAQGTSALKKHGKVVKNNKTKKVYAHKKTSTKFTKKGNPSTEIKRGFGGYKARGDKKLTGFIHNNIEELMASRVLAQGTKMSMNDIAGAGKERLKETNRNALKKKKSRTEEKLQQAIKMEE